VQVASPHIVRVVVTGSQCGVRVGPSELFRLTWDDVDLTQGILRVARKNINAPWRDVPIRDNLLPLFRQWQEENRATVADYIINCRGKPVQNIRTAWFSALRMAGITRRIRPYDLRHSLAAELIAKGVDVGTIARRMGHSSPIMILNHYQYVMDEQKRAAVEALPSLQYVPQKICPKEKAPAP